MSKTNFLICSGEACPLRLICERFHAWVDNEDDDADEMIPNFHKSECKSFIRKEFFYGG